MKNILTIIKKELLRVIKDPRLIFVLVMPGLLIYFMYSFIGDAFSGADNDAQNAEYSIVTVYLPDEVEKILKSEELGLNASFTNLAPDSQAEVDEIVADKKESVKTGGIDILLVFDKDFAETINANSGGKPEVQVYYNSSQSISGYAYQKVYYALQVYKSGVLSDRQVDPEVFRESTEAVYDDKTVAAQGFAMLIPFLIISFLFSGCMSIAPDAIAGEKERGTIATVLITPVKRSELALGKISSLSILAVVSALSSFLGIMLSLPKLTGGGVSLTALYGFAEYGLLLLTLISTVLLIIGVMSIISAFAKSVKEASMLLVPFMLVSMVVGLITMVNGTAATSAAAYIIPIYNSVQAMVSILTFEVNILNLVITFVSNIIYLVICVFALTKLFNNEKVMFAK